MACSSNAVSPTFEWVREVHTLGPSGTNCELAAFAWIERRCPHATLNLHQSFEDAAISVGLGKDVVLLGAAAYPDLNVLIYANLERFEIIDVTIVETA